MILGDQHHPVMIELGDQQAKLGIDGRSLQLACEWHPGRHLLGGQLDGEAFAVKIVPSAQGYHLRLRGVGLQVLVCRPAIAEMHKRLPEKEKPDLSKMVISPMPGLVVSVDVEVGQEVQEGEAICIVEAMKMQNIIRADATGSIKSVNVSAGDSVAADEIMVELE